VAEYVGHGAVKKALPTRLLARALPGRDRKEAIRQDARERYRTATVREPAGRCREEPVWFQLRRIRVQRRVFGQALACIVLAHSATGLDAQRKSDEAPPEKVYDLGPELTPPKVIKQVPPRQSTAHGVRIVGTVTVALIVSSQGIPKDVRVVKGLDKDLDQSTVEAVGQWRFEPARKDGKPVAVRVSLDIAFHDM